jgi:hypothetical protein
MPKPVSYTVTAVSPSVDYGPTGSQIPGKTLTFTTTTGYEGTIFIPSSVFPDLATVQAMIENEVRLVAAAQAITGTVTGS